MNAPHEKKPFGLVAPIPRAYGGHIRYATSDGVVLLPYSPPARTELDFQRRIQRIKQSQAEYKQLFGSLFTIIEQLKIKYPIGQQQENDDIASNCVEERSSSSASSVSADSLFNVPQNGRKRKLHAEEVEVLDLTGTGHFQARPAEYPKLWPANPPLVIIGPNGTTVEAREFHEMSWEVVASSTRYLLALVFSNETLATHTLTGKPSPAFYGRERPAKMQLDPKRVEDVVLCVRVMTGAKERDVRAAITTKCADMAKKLKRGTLKSKH